MKERVTLTLDSGLLKRIDQNIDGHEIKNRSHAIELLLLKALGDRKPSKALILAGGEDSSLSSAIGELPKCLAPLGERTIIEHAIELFRRFDIKQIIISAGKHLKALKEHLGDGSQLGVTLTYLEEKAPLGTAGPIRQAKHLLTGPFFVSNADDLKEINLLDLFVFHSEHGGLATIALKTVSDPSAYGVANMTGNHIISFMEKPALRNAPSNLVNAGLYIMEPEVVDYIPEGFSVLERDVFPKLARENQLYGYSFSGRWLGVNTIADYELAKKEWASAQ
ncbi:nucleotidyltransferase family protein [Candidatus Woesearchaeota archaeon]|nr:nucleotidyltransferase family protein [Candidatus Woesearchaeota archaeon]